MRCCSIATDWTATCCYTLGCCRRSAVDTWCAWLRAALPVGCGGLPEAEARRVVSVIGDTPFCTPITDRGDGYYVRRRACVGDMGQFDDGDDRMRENPRRGGSWIILRAAGGDRGCGKAIAVDNVDVAGQTLRATNSGAVGKRLASNDFEVFRALRPCILAVRR